MSTLRVLSKGSTSSPKIIANGYAEITVDGATSPGIIFRSDGSDHPHGGNGYAVFANIPADRLDLFLVENGGISGIGLSTNAINVGDVIRVAFSGSSIIVTQNGTTRISITNGVYSSGRVGISGGSGGELIGYCTISDGPTTDTFLGSAGPLSANWVVGYNGGGSDPTLNGSGYALMGSAAGNYVYYVDINSDGQCELYKNDDLLLDGTRGWNAIELNAVAEDIFDYADDWVSGDPTNFAVSQETVDIENGTGAVEIAAATSVGVCDSYPESNYLNGNMGLNDTQTAVGHSFTGDGKTLYATAFLVQDNSVVAPVGTLYGKIYAHTGTYGTDGMPTGAVLATSDPIDAATVADDMALIIPLFTGAERIIPENGVKYVTVLELETTDEDTSIRVAIDYSSPTHGGNACNYYSGSWHSNTNDAIFYVYTSDVTDRHIAYDLGAGNEIDLSGVDVLPIAVKCPIDIDFILSFGESAHDEQSVALNILGNASDYVIYELDISSIADADKDAVRYLKLKQNEANAEAYGVLFDAAPDDPIFAIPLLSVINSGTWDTYANSALGDDFATWLNNVIAGHCLLIGINGSIATPTTNLLTALENEAGVIFPERFTCVAGNGSPPIDPRFKSFVFAAKKGELVLFDNYDLTGATLLDEECVIDELGQKRICKIGENKEIKFYETADIDRILGRSPMRVKYAAAAGAIAAYPALNGIGNTGKFVRHVSETLGVRDYLTSTLKTYETFTEESSGAFGPAENFCYGGNCYSVAPWVLTTPWNRVTELTIEHMLNSGPTTWTWCLMAYTQNGWEALATNVLENALATWFTHNYRLDYERTVYKIAIVPASWQGSNPFTASLQFDPIFLLADTNVER